jgi:hypothetical protein
MLDAPRGVIAFIPTQHYKRRETERVAPFCKFQTILQSMLRRQDRDNSRSIRVGSQIDRDMPKVRFFAAADRAIRHERKTAKRNDLAHEPIAVDPGIDALFKWQIHARRAHFNVQKESLGIVQGLE